MEKFKIHQKIFLVYLIAAIIWWMFLATINIPLTITYLVYLISFFLIIKGKKIGWLLMTIVFLGKFLLWFIELSIFNYLIQVGFLVLGVYSLTQYLNLKKYQRIMNIIIGITATYMLLSPSTIYLWIVHLLPAVGVFPIPSTLIWSAIITVVYWLVVIYWIKYKK